MNAFQILTSKFRFDLMHWNVSIGPEKWPIFGHFLSSVISIKTRKKYLQHGGDHRWRHGWRHVQVLYWNIFEGRFWVNLRLVIYILRIDSHADNQRTIYLNHRWLLRVPMAYSAGILYYCQLGNLRTSTNHKQRRYCPRAVWSEHLGIAGAFKKFC
jgi:hypothetical protein